MAQEMSHKEISATPCQIRPKPAQICYNSHCDEWSNRSRQPTGKGTVVPLASRAQGRKANGHPQVTLIGL
jgi:hypothetical protein